MAEWRFSQLSLASRTLPSLSHTQIAMPLSGGRCYQHLALGPTGVIAASYDGMVHLLNGSTGEMIDSIEAHEGAIAEMHWCPKLLKVCMVPWCMRASVSGFPALSMDSLFYMGRAF